MKQFGTDVTVIEPGIIRTEFGDVAPGPLQKRSGNSAYVDIVKRMMASMENLESSGFGSPPSVIADAILKSLRVKRPKARYTTGFVGVLMIEGWIGTCCADTTKIGGAANRVPQNTFGVRLLVRGPRKLNGTEMPSSPTASPATGPRALEAACSLSPG